MPYALGICGNAGLNIALISLLTHRLVPEVYGDYSVAMTAIVLASSVLGQWLQQATGRFLAGAPPQAASYTKAAVLLGASGILLVLGVLYVLAAVFNQLNYVSGTALGLIAIVGVAAQTLFTLIGATLQSAQYAWSYALQQMCAGSLKIGFSFLVCRVSQRDIDGLLYACAAAQFIGVAFGASRAGLFDKVVLEKLRSPRAFVMLRKLRAYGGTMTLWFVLMNLAMYCDRLLVRALAGSTTAGFYGAASTLVVGSVSLVIAPVLAATWPQLMAAWNLRDEQAAARLLGNLLTALLCVGIVLVAGVSAVAEPATRLLLGEQFVSAAPLLPVLSAAAFSFSLGPFFHKPFEFQQRKMLMCIFAASVLLLNAALSATLTPRFGGMGAGTAGLVSGSTYCVLCTLWGRKIVRWQIRLDLLAEVAAAAAGALVIVSHFSTSWHFDSNLLKFAAAGLAFAAVFGAGLAAIVLLQANR
jgi:O-antigen/teichoic acid export membrane protein